mgnify:CR=1 FL=1
MALAPIADARYTLNPFYEMYSRYWRSLWSSVRSYFELWGKGYQERMANNKYPETMHMLEQVFWKSFSANKEYDDPERIEAYMGHFPHGGVGHALIEHLGQVYQNGGDFRYFDYNQLREDKMKINNEIRYRNKKPPIVDFTQIANSSVPFHMYSANHDQWAHPSDSQWLYRQTSDWANHETGMYETTTAGPRSYT